MIELIPIADIPAGTLQRVRANQHDYLVANIDGEILCTDDQCTHEDASLSRGALHGDCVSCPLHGSRFNLRNGQPLEEPAEDPLKTYPVEIRDGMVCISR